MPTASTIEDGQYQPLSRPMFIYVNKKSLKRPEVMAFVEFYMVNGRSLVSEVGYVPLQESVYQDALTKIRDSNTD